MREDRATRRIHASPEVVFRAFTEPEVLVSWLPPAGMTGRLDRFDASGYRMVLTYDLPPGDGGKASPDSDVSEVRRVHMDPDGREIVEAVDFPSADPAYAGTMTMIWTFEPVDGGTEVSVTARDVPVGISQSEHLEGLVVSLAQLAHAVE